MPVPEELMETLSHQQSHPQELKDMQQQREYQPDMGKRGDIMGDIENSVKQHSTNVVEPKSPQHIPTSQVIVSQDFTTVTSNMMYVDGRNEAVIYEIVNEMALQERHNPVELLAMETQETTRGEEYLHSVNKQEELLNRMSASHIVQEIIVTLSSQYRFHVFSGCRLVNREWTSKTMQLRQGKSSGRIYLCWSKYIKRLHRWSIHENRLFLLGLDADCGNAEVTKQNIAFSGQPKRLTRRKRFDRNIPTPYAPDASINTRNRSDDVEKTKNRCQLYGTRHLEPSQELIGSKCSRDPFFVLHNQMQPGTNAETKAEMTVEFRMENIPCNIGQNFEFQNGITTKPAEESSLQESVVAQATSASNVSVNEKPYIRLGSTQIYIATASGMRRESIEHDENKQIHSERIGKRSRLPKVMTLLMLPALTMGSSDVYTKPSTSGTKQSFNYPVLAICTVDGNVLVVNARSGEPICAFSSGSPLVGPSQPFSEQGRRIVPGLDGQLYVSSEDGFLKPLEITVLDVLANPVKTCKRAPSSPVSSAEDPLLTPLASTECGIVTATKSTSLFALDAASGNLVWSQHPNGTTVKTNTIASHTVLLQREDVVVQQINTETGESVWSVSLGALQALEFEEPPTIGDLPPSPQGMLPSGRPGRGDSRKSILLEDYLEDLPHVFFSEDGTILGAVDPNSNNGKRLWQREFPTVVASVFGLNRNSWEALAVLDEGNADEELVENGNNRLLMDANSALTQYSSPSMNYMMPFFQGMDRLFRSDRQRGKSLWLKGSPSLKRQIDNRVTAVDFVRSPLSSVDLRKSNILPVQRLALPSPELLEAQRHRSDSLRYDGRGIYFSWSLLVVAVVFVLAAAIAVGRFVYKKKKSHWVKRTTVSFDLNSIAKYRSTSEGSIDDNGITISAERNPKMILRSHSLPVNMDDLADMVGLDGCPASISSPATPAQHPKSTTETSASQGVGLIDGSIPLIQYSRYASEFEELGALGKGGFGSVYQCRNALDGRDYAIKKVHIRRSPNLSQSEFSSRLQKTLREVKSLALLDHPNIVRYYTAWLEVDQETGDAHLEHLQGSDYYLLSPTSSGHMHRAYNDISETSDSWQQNDKSYNYNGSLSMVSKEMDDSESSSQFFHEHITGVPDALDDFGFVFDRSNEDNAENHESSGNETERAGTHCEDYRKQTMRHSVSSSFQNYSPRRINFQSLGSDVEQEATTKAKGLTPKAELGRLEDNKSCESHTPPLEEAVSIKYILYIQMQFCSQKTLADFLSNDEARKGTSNASSGVDIPHALSLFLQVMQGVTHVHTQGLIHRDLKPTNCFIDDSGAVKVGDFGLSRESGDSSTTEDTESIVKEPALFGNGDITAGVGTRSYASPEQMKGGSDYDSSTDIYSLGIILFELCYPMYTGMERNIVLSDLRKHKFPIQWMKTIHVEFPTLHTLLLTMISHRPEDRPSAQSVVKSVRSILEGFTITSLDKHDHEGAILLRVETQPREDVLRYTMDLIRDSCLPVPIDIVQYGLRGGFNKGQMKSIMEFAIVPLIEDATNSCPRQLGSSLVTILNDNPQVLLARQVSASKNN